MITEDDINELYQWRIAYLHWEFWRYSFARTLLLSGADVNGKRLCMLIELVEYIDLPIHIKNPVFSQAPIDEIQVICNHLPHAREQYDRTPFGFLKVLVNGKGYYLWAHKLTIIDENDYPDLTQYIDEEIARLEQAQRPV